MAQYTRSAIGKTEWSPPLASSGVGRGDPRASRPSSSSSNVPNPRPMAPFDDNKKEEPFPFDYRTPARTRSSDSCSPNNSPPTTHSPEHPESASSVANSSGYGPSLSTSSSSAAYSSGFGHCPSSSSASAANASTNANDSGIAAAHWDEPAAAAAEPPQEAAGRRHRSLLARQREDESLLTRPPGVPSTGTRHNLPFSLSNSLLPQLVLLSSSSHPVHCSLLSA